MIEHTTEAPKHIKYMGAFLLAALTGAVMWLHLDGDANDRKRLKQCYEDIRRLEDGR